MIPPKHMRFDCRDCGFTWWSDDDPGETPREPCPECRSVNLEVFDPRLMDVMW